MPGALEENPDVRTNSLGASLHNDSKDACFASASVTGEYMTGAALKPQEKTMSPKRYLDRRYFDRRFSDRTSLDRRLLDRRKLWVDLGATEERRQGERRSGEDRRNQDRRSGEERRS